MKCINFSIYNFGIFLSRYFTESTEKLFDKAGIKASNIGVNDLNLKEIFLDNKEDVSCTICYSDELKLQSLSCKHTFCESCWEEYVINKVNEGENLVIKCPEVKCDMILGDETISKIVIKTGNENKYRKWASKCYVESNKLMRYCVGENCTNVLSVEYVAQRDVYCTCGANFCFDCYNDSHYPLPCWIIKKWMEITETDIKSIVWIKVNSKRCPECGTAIEKYIGCNHMTCTKHGCKCHFCWVCLKPWKTHTDYFNCTAYVPKIDPDMEQDKRDLEKFHFFESRYNDVKNVLKKKEKFYLHLINKMDEFCGFHTESDAVYAKILTDKLCIYFQIHMLTYILGYFIKKSSHYELFTRNQANFSASLDSICDDIENSIFPDILSLRRSLNDKIEYCRKRKEAMFKYMKECLSENYCLTKSEFVNRAGIC